MQTLLKADNKINFGIRRMKIFQGDKAIVVNVMKKSRHPKQYLSTITESLAQGGIDDMVCKWIQSMLINRIIIASHGLGTRTSYISRGLLKKMSFPRFYA